MSQVYPAGDRPSKEGSLGVLCATYRCLLHATWLRGLNAHPQHWGLRCQRWAHFQLCATFLSCIPSVAAQSLMHRFKLLQGGLHPHPWPDEHSVCMTFALHLLWAEPVRIPITGCRCQLGQVPGLCFTPAGRPGCSSRHSACGLVATECSPLTAVSRSAT